MSFKLCLAKHLNVTGDEDNGPKWAPICKVHSCSYHCHYSFQYKQSLYLKMFWIKYYFLTGKCCVFLVAGLVPYIGSKAGPLETYITAGWIAICVKYIYIFSFLLVNTMYTMK